MNKTVWAGFAIAAALSGGAAQARDIYWSVDIQAPVYPAGRIGTSISNAPRAYYAAPVIVVPQPVYVSAPVAYLPPPVYVPQRVVYRPYPVVYPHHAYGAYKAKWKHGKHRGRHDDHDDDD
jgi:hypothetical protein